MNNHRGRNSGQAFEQMVGRPPTGKPKKIMNVKVTEKAHAELSKTGCVSVDIGDVVKMLLEF